jgi:hypothetical protein
VPTALTTVRREGAPRPLNFVIVLPPMSSSAVAAQKSNA